ncbi:MAG: hypothetical protein LUE64_06255, partial [Candidatus Gastranaerophilales bacterium]|nr:hypothetical protein [Candidatus Gastranaerophilales bacterium]
MEIIFYITLFLYIFIFGSCTDFADYDFFARLIVGKTFFQTGDILKYDFLSYSNTHPWWDHEWGASVIFYFVHEHFGDIGLLILKTLCLFFAFFIFIRIIKLRRKILYKDSKFPIFNFLFFFIMLQPVANFVFSLRCHHFTFFFFALWLYVLEKSRLEKNYRILWVLPPLMTVWSNIHGGCFMGLGILGLYIIGEFLSKKRFAPYIYALIFSFLFMLINPYGFEYVKFLFTAATMTRPNIIEWLSPLKNVFAAKLIKFKIVLFSFVILSIYRFIKTKPKFKDFDKTKFL